MGMLLLQKLRYCSTVGARVPLSHQLRRVWKNRDKNPPRLSAPRLFSPLLLGLVCEGAAAAEDGTRARALVERTGCAPEDADAAAAPSSFVSGGAVTWSSGISGMAAARKRRVGSKPMAAVRRASNIPSVERQLRRRRRRCCWRLGASSEPISRHYAGGHERRKRRSASPCNYHWPKQSCCCVLSWLCLMAMSREGEAAWWRSCGLSAFDILAFARQGPSKWLRAHAQQCSSLFDGVALK